MNDPLDTEFFNAIERVSTSPSSFSGMLEYFQVQKPEQWMSLVESLMEISKREYSNVSALGFKLEEMIDDYAAYMDSEPKI
jgi:hypothetical protein